MEKIVNLNLKYTSIILFSPNVLKIKEGTNYLSSYLDIISNLSKSMNDSQFVVLKLDESREYNFHFSDGEVDEKVLNNYKSYLRRGVLVKNNDLVIEDVELFENYSDNKLKNHIQLKNGYYIVHIFCQFDEDVFIYFEKVDKKPKLNVYVDNRADVHTNLESKHYDLSDDYNYLVNNFYDYVSKDLVNKQFSKDDNNYVYELGKLNIKSGKLAIFNAMDFSSMDYVMNNDYYLDRDIPAGNYKILLAMRNSHYYGTYITGVKVVFSKKEVLKYKLAATAQGGVEFGTRSYYAAICDFDEIENYKLISQSSSLLPGICEGTNLVVEEFQKNLEKFKDIFDIHNYFMMFEDPSSKNKVAIFNVELGITKFFAYYGLGKDDELVELYIPLIDNDIFSHKELVLEGNEDEYIDDCVLQIKEVINKYIDYLRDTEEYNDAMRIVLPDKLKLKIERIIFRIKDYNLEELFIPKMFELFDEYPNFDFSIKSDWFYGILKGRYDCNKLIYKSINDKPTFYKVYLLSKYLFQTGYKAKYNKLLFSCLKKLRGSSNILVKSEAIKRYNEITDNVNNKKGNKKIIIFLLVIFLLGIIVSAICKNAQYEIIAGNRSNNRFFIESEDTNYRMYYKVPSKIFEATKMESNEVWFSTIVNDITDSNRIKAIIYNGSSKEYIDGLLEEKEGICSTNTEYSKINCFDEKEDIDYKLGEFSYYYLSYAFVENEKSYFVSSHLIYEIDDDTYVVITNDLYDFAQEEFISLSENIMQSIRKKR